MAYTRGTTLWEARVKLLIGLIVLGGLALGVVYFVNYSGFDPTQAGNKARAAVSVGMTPAQVLSAAGEPGRYRVGMMVKQTVDGQEVDVVKEGPELRFDRALFEQDLKRGAMPHGFRLIYYFSHQAAFSVSFDTGARVVAVENVKTVADLLDSRG